MSGKKAREEKIVKFGYTRDSFGHIGHRVYEAVQDNKKPVADLCDKFELACKINSVVETMSCYDMIMAVVMIKGIDIDEEIAVGIKRVGKNDNGPIKEGEIIIWNDQPSKDQEQMIYPGLKENEIRVPIATPSEVSEAWHQMAAERKPQPRE